MVKPAISAGGRSSARFEADEDEAARALVARIHAEGRTAMVQPYLDDVEEKALVYIDGEYSHALPAACPARPRATARSSTSTRSSRPREAAEQEREIAEAALACAPGELLYGRVDLVGGAVLELEIAEPSLYLAFGAGAADRFARAIVGCLGRGTPVVE